MTHQSSQKFFIYWNAHSLLSFYLRDNPFSKVGGRDGLVRPDPRLNNKCSHPPTYRPLLEWGPISLQEDFCLYISVVSDNRAKLRDKDIPKRGWVPGRAHQMPKKGNFCIFTKTTLGPWQVPRRPAWSSWAQKSSAESQGAGESIVRLPSEGNQHGVCIKSSINLGETLFGVTPE